MVDNFKKYANLMEIHKKLNKKKDEILKETFSIEGELQSCSSLIKFNSSFNPREIGEVISYLINSIENEDYGYLKKAFILEKPDLFEKENKTFNAVYYISAVMPRKYNDLDKISNSLIESGEVLILCEDIWERKDEGCTYLYRGNLVGNDVDSLMFRNQQFLKRFTYISDFIHMVINYRIENDTDMDKFTLDKLKEQFLKEYKAPSLILALE